MDIEKLIIKYYYINKLKNKKQRCLLNVNKKVGKIKNDFRGKGVYHMFNVMGSVFV